MEWMYSWWTLLALVWLTIGSVGGMMAAGVSGASHRNSGNRRGENESTVAVVGYMFTVLALLLSIVAWIVGNLVR